MNIKKYIIYSFLAFGFMACDSQLDIEPYQSVREPVALKNSANIEAVLNGAYDVLGANSTYGGNHIRDAVLLAQPDDSDDEVEFIGTFQAVRSIYTKNITTSNDEITDKWMAGYEAINVVNNVLSVIDVVDEDKKDEIEGGALFIRALSYYGLVTFYANQYDPASANSDLGVPLKLTPTTTEDVTTNTQNINLARSTVEQVYNQIISDLQKASTLLPYSNGIFATQGAAEAFLARVYLQQGRYAEALASANNVIESGDYRLLGNYEDNFANSSLTDEDLFIIQVTPQDGLPSVVNFFGSRSVGRGDIPVLGNHLDLYGLDDVRGQFFYRERGDNWTSKWSNPTNNKVNVIRLAEMYLIRAECNERLNSSTGASPVDDINMIRERAGATTLSSVTLDDILMERRLELAFEGFRIHDIKRTQGTVGGLSYDDPTLVFPIPQREIDVNPNLVQNIGY